MVADVNKKRGAVAIQVAIMLPILVIIMIGAFELWKVLYMQQVLNDAAYQGVRLLCLQPAHGDTTIEAEQLVRRYVSQAPFADPALRADPYDEGLLYVSVDAFPARCGSGVSVSVDMHWRVGQPTWSRGGGAGTWLPFLGRAGTMTGHAEGVVLCERRDD
jgi:Flp pilus assembly protein TadG